MAALTSWRAEAAGAWAGLLALSVFVLALWAQADALVGVFFDDGVYVTLAKALAEGEGYSNIHLPGTPAGVHFPPLYPLALSVLWRAWPAFPDNQALFRLFDAGCLAIAALLVARHAERAGVSAGARHLALPAGFAAFPLLTVVGVRLSEPLFLALAAGAVLVADGSRVTPVRAAGAGALAGLAALTRGIGITIVLGVALAYWLRRERRAAAIALAVGVIVLAPWTVWVAVHGSTIDPLLAANYGLYVHNLREAGPGSFLGALTLRAFGPLARLTLPRMPAWLWYPAAAGVVALVVWGAARAGRRMPALVAALALYLVVVSLWFFAPDRFVWIVLPWLALFAALGAREAWQRGTAFRAALLALALAAAAGFLRAEVLSLAGRRFAATAEGASRPFALLVSAIAAEAPTDAVLAGPDEALLYLYTGRHAVPSSLHRWVGRGTVSRSPEETIGLLCTAGVTHLVSTGPGGPGASLIEALAARSDSALTAAFAFTRGPALYRFRCPR